MIELDLQKFNQLLELSDIKPRLKRELRFVASTEDMETEDWLEAEMVPIKDKTRNKGVLLVALSDRVYILPFEIKQLAKSATTGRAQAVICDICKTWQSGPSAGSITFTNLKKSSSNIAYLCCLDLQCSKHVRTKTSASKVSRAQLRESLNNEQRIERLTDRLEQLMQYLDAQPILVRQVTE